MIFIRPDKAGGRILQSVIIGLSTDAKPANGAMFIEIDTGDVYVLVGAVWTIIGGGGGDVTAAANLGDNLLIRGDGAVKGVQNSGITVSDGDDISGIVDITATGTITFSGASELLVPTADPAADSEVSLDITPPAEFADDLFTFWGGSQLMRTIALAEDELPSGAGEDGWTVNYNATNNEFELVAPVAGGGDVTKVGTPVDDQIGVWTGDGTLEGDADFTYNGTLLNIQDGNDIGGITMEPYTTGSHNWMLFRATETNHETIVAVMPNGVSASASGLAVFNEDDRLIHGRLLFAYRDEFGLLQTSTQGAAAQSITKMAIELDPSAVETGEEFLVGANGPFSSGAPTIMFRVNFDSSFSFVRGSLGVGIDGPVTNLHVQESTTDTVPTVEIEQLSTGDAGLQFSIVGDAFAFGIDNSDNDLLKMAYASTAGTAVLGTNDFFEASGVNWRWLLNESLAADGDYSGTTIEGTAGAALTFGQLCYLAVADGRWELTDADAEATAGDVLLGICVLAAAADGNATRMLLWGKVRADTAFPALTVGAVVFASGTAGAVTNTAPSGSADAVRALGHSYDADELIFTPSPDWLIVA